MSSTLPAEPVTRQVDLERFNLASNAKSFDCKFIEPGIISYRDQGGGIELLKKETIDRCIASAIGNPLVIDHHWVNAENRMTLEHGIVLEAYYNSDTGWHHVKGTVDTDRAKSLMRVKRPSCGYSVTSFGPGGMYHGIRYDKEITGIKFNHLAIVDKPRYEDAIFRLNSLNNPKHMNLFKLIYQALTRENDADGKPVEGKKTESLDLPGDTVLEIDGTPVHLNDLGKKWMDQTKAAVETAPEMTDATEVDVDGAKVKMNELKDAYRKCSSQDEAELTRKNAADEAKKKLDEEAEATRKNAAAVAFAQLHIASKAVPVAANTQSSDSMSERLALGKKRY